MTHNPPRKPIRSQDAVRILQHFQRADNAYDAAQASTMAERYRSLDSRSATIDGEKRELVHVRMSDYGSLSPRLITALHDGGFIYAERGGKMLPFAEACTPSAADTAFPRAEGPRDPQHTGFYIDFSAIETARSAATNVSSYLS